MTNIFTIVHNDKDYEDGYEYPIGSFPELQQAEFVKQKLDALFNVIVERAYKYSERHPDCYLLSVQERMFNALKKHPKYSYIKAVDWSQWAPIAPYLYIQEQVLYNDFHDYKRSLLNGCD